MNIINQETQTTTIPAFPAGGAQWSSILRNQGKQNKKHEMNSSSLLIPRQEALANEKLLTDAYLEYQVNLTMGNLPEI
jgi:hypothetical protein